MPNSSIPGIRKIRHASDTNFGLPNPSKNGLVVTYESSTDKFILAAAPGGGGGTNDHAALLNLSYAASGHTGFAGTGVSNTFTQLNTFSNGVSVTGGNLAVTNNANITGDVNVGDDVHATGDVTAASIISPLLTSATNVDVTINPGGTGNVLLPNDTPIRTQTFDSSFPIGGFKIGPTNIGGQSGMTVGVIEADEIRTRVFVADETRVDRGDEYWTRSYGILSAGYTTPATIGGSNTITIDDSAALTGAIAADNYWAMLRKVDVTGGISTSTSWGQLVGYVDNGNGTQSWTFVLRAGDTSEQYLRGYVVTIFGQSGDGLIHLSTVDPAGAPYIKMRTFVTNPYTPANYTTHVQIGNLASTGVSGYSPVGHGFFARPGVSASRFIVLDQNGFQIRGADFRMFNGANQTVDIEHSNGSLQLGTNVTNANTRGFYFNGITGDITIGGGSYSPTVTIYGQMVIKSGSSGYGQLSDRPVTLNSINNAEYAHLTSIAANATVGATWGTNLNSIPTRFGNAPSGAGLYLTPTHLGYYDGSAWKAWIASNGFFYFGGNSGAHLEWNGTKLRGIATNGTTETWYASSTDGILYGGSGSVWMDQNGYNIAATQFGSADLIRFMRSGSVLASIGYQRNAGGGPLTTDGMIFNVYEGTKFRFVGGTKIEHDGGLTVDDFIETSGRLQGFGLVVNRGALTDAAVIQGTTHYSQFASSTTEHTYIRGGKAASDVYINDTSGLGNVVLAGGGGSINLNGPAVFGANNGGTATTKALRQYGVGTDGSRSWVSAIGMSLHWNGTNYRTGTDGATNGGTLLLGGGDGSTFEVFTIPSTGGTAQTIAAAALGSARRFYINANGTVITGPLVETASGADGIRMGLAGGEPEIILEDAGSAQIGLGNSAGTFRITTPGVANHVAVSGTTGNMVVGGAAVGSIFDWKLNVISSTYQLSLNPNFSGVNYLSSYDGPLGAPLGLYGTRVFADANSFGISTAKTPTGSADASGSVGDIAWDTGFLYVKTAVGGWKRAALSTF